nr:hypothetical protein [Tanacetum cinerariifolium]
VDEDDIDMIFDSKKKQKKLDPLKHDKDQARSLKQGKSSSNPSKSNKLVDAYEVIHDVETDARECIEDAAHDSIPTALVVNMSKWFKQSTRPATLETPNLDWSKDQNTDTGPEQNWFPELEKTAKAPKDFDFSNFMKYRLKKDTLTKVDLEGLVFKLFKGTYRSSIELEYTTWSSVI